MRKVTLQFLRRESDDLRQDINILQAGQREIFEVSKTGRRSITLTYLDRLRDRLGRFEEMIAAYESGLS